MRYNWFDTIEEKRDCRKSPECWENHQRRTRKKSYGKSRKKYNPTLEEAVGSPELWATKRQNWKRSGIVNPPTRDQYIRLLELTAGICPLCGRPPGQKGFNLHHSHVTGEWIGLICGACNLGLGQFNDNPLLLMKAAQYVSSETEYEAIKEHIFDEATNLNGRDVVSGVFWNVYSITE